MSLPALLQAANPITGDWVAQIQTGGDPQYARVVIRQDGAALTGTFNEATLEGSITDGHLALAVLTEGKPEVTLSGSVSGEIMAGEGTIAMRGGLQPITWILSRPAPAIRLIARLTSAPSAATWITT